MTRHVSTKTLRRRYQRLANRVIRRLLDAGIAPRSYALLETTGRRSGQPRQTPVGNGLVKNTHTFWLVSEMGAKAAYVRNLQANPQVRVKIGRTWHTGTAHTLADDDARARQRSMPSFNAAAVRFFGEAHDMVTVRIDLDPPARS